MDSLANFNCTLRTLRLDFVFLCEMNSVDEDLQNGSFVTSTVTAGTLKQFVRQEDFREAVVNLKVESMIKLSVTTRRMAYCTIFQELADAIGLKKQWAVVEDRYAMPLGPAQFTKQWVLTPATLSTR